MIFEIKRNWMQRGRTALLKKFSANILWLQHFLKRIQTFLVFLFYFLRSRRIWLVNEYNGLFLRPSNFDSNFNWQHCAKFRISFKNLIQLQKNIFVAANE